jgi:adenosine deaminase
MSRYKYLVNIGQQENTIALITFRAIMKRKRRRNVSITCCPLSSMDKSEHVIKQCFKTSFDLYRQLMDNIKHVIKQEKCYKTLRYITFFLSFF